MNVPIKTAIISVSDRSGLGEIAQHLHQMRVAIYSTGGTFRALQGFGVKATPIDELTQFPEIMDGRVKTLHPAVFAGILARRDNPKDMETLRAHQMRPIDLVVSNLHPFAKLAAEADATPDEIIDHIDIGGLSMLRAAAKNFRDVAVVVDPVDYGAIIDETLQNEGSLSLETRRRLALKVFERTAEYDRAIARHLTETTP
jgi:phosphoribosylaminoimidazolecarboxamide formyltransferase/IMP cyclohydrolase